MKKIISFIKSLYWKTLGKRKINKIVKIALKEPLPDMSQYLIGKL